MYFKYNLDLVSLARFTHYPRLRLDKYFEYDTWSFLKEKVLSRSVTWLDINKACLHTRQSVGIMEAGYRGLVG